MAPQKDTLSFDDAIGTQSNDATDNTADQPLLQKAFSAISDVGKGALKGALSTISAPDEWMREHGPAFMTNQNFGFGKPADLEHVKQMATPTNTPQAIGKGIEQVGEFLIPGGAEEKGAAKLAELAPWARKAAKPLARVLTTGTSSGLVNKAQGGTFKAGAAAGAFGAGLGQLAHAAAPSLAESSLNIRKLDRAYGRKPGLAALEETKGFSPSSVAESAEEKLGELNPQLNAAADRASVRPNPVRGLLKAPNQEIPLAARTRAPKSRPMTFNAEINPEEPMEPRSGNPMADISEYPGINPHYLSGSAHPELSGRIPTNQGVLIRPAPTTGGPIPTQLANPIASLSPARDVLTHAFGTASRQGERTTVNQLQPMATHLSETIGGQPIPSNVTPRQLLDLKRGFGNEFIHRWNPETMTGVKGTAARTYHEMGEEFNRTVPGARELNSRISNLIPVAKRAESAELNAPTGQRILNRFGAHTGALAGGLFGANEGYREKGLPGAIAGGLVGVAAPEMIASPTGQMMLARTLHSGASRVLPKVFVGGGLQLERPDNSDEKKKKGGND